MSLYLISKLKERWYNKDMSKEGAGDSNEKKTNSFLVIILATIFISSTLIMLVFFNVGNVQGLLGGLFSKGQDVAVSDETYSESNDKSPEVSRKENSVQESDETINVEELKHELELKKKEIEDMKNDLISQKDEIALKREQALKELEEATNIRKKLSDELIEVKSLAKIYEGMESKKAVAILEAIEDDAIIRKILAQMKKDKVAEILQEMRPSRSARILNYKLNNDLIIN